VNETSGEDVEDLVSEVADTVSVKKSDELIVAELDSEDRV
jgi:hypothetical protein